MPGDNYFKYEEDIVKINRSCLVLFLPQLLILQILISGKSALGVDIIYVWENLFWVDKINKKGNYSLSFSPKFMNALIKEAKSKPKDKIDIFFQKLVIIQVYIYIYITYRERN